MLSPTYTSVKNANLVDCGKKQHIPSQPLPLLRDKFLGEYRTELDKKKVLANLGIATDLSLEWEYIKGDIGRSEALMNELDSRTKYTSKIDGFTKTLIEGVLYLESVIGGDLEAEEKQNERIKALEDSTKELVDNLAELKTYLEETIEISIDELQDSLEEITGKVNNITDLIKVSDKEGNALVMFTEDDVEEGQTPGLYVPDLSEDVTKATEDIKGITKEVTDIKESLDAFVTREELGGGDFDFVSLDDFDQYTEDTDEEIGAIKEDLRNTVKTGEDGHVNTLYVNQISKDNEEGNIKITDSFEVESNIPLDVRAVVSNLDELKALSANVCYAGMGVIVNSLSSLYILRDPSEGQIIDQEYISDIYNWKCPEDLVTVAMPRNEYEALEEINPNVFYYIYEEDIKRTQEPKRENFLTEEEFLEAWQTWTDSLKVLSLEYMSASWGVDIENKLANKASAQSILILNQQIELLKGGNDGVSLESLNTEIDSLKELDITIVDRLDAIFKTENSTKTGLLVDVTTLITEVTNSLENYITKEELSTISGDFNFVKPEDYEADKDAFNKALAENITTKEIILNGSLLQVEDEVLLLNSEALAKTSDVPEIKILTLKEYDDLPIKEENTYYYTYDDNKRYITTTEFESVTAELRAQIASLRTDVTVLQELITVLQALLLKDE